MRMTSLAASLTALALAACANAPTAAEPEAALAAYFAAVDAPLATAGAGAALPGADAAIQEIAFGSCNTAERPIPILRTVAADKPDLFVYAGDNVYGDTRGDMTLPELREQYAKLAAHEDFRALRAAAPMVATWDDHDYGLNDAGGDFTPKAFAKRIFETFWGVGDRLADRDGVYDSYVFGPEGKRVQVILLDTRSARSTLARLAERGPRGPYAPSDDPAQRMLSERQWDWLAGELKKPADVRILVSSIQIVADGHNFEGWYTMPKEQARLYRTIDQAGAKGVVMVSGDRHSAGLYRRDGLISYPIYEMTASSLNLSFARSSDERSTGQLGDMFTATNYGVIGIDWTARSLKLQLKDEAGQVVREQAVPLAEIGAA